MLSLLQHPTSQEIHYCNQRKRFVLINCRKGNYSVEIVSFFAAMAQWGFSIIYKCALSTKKASSIDKASILELNLLKTET
jgi:hypothetical protein